MSARAAADARDVQVVWRDMRAPLVAALIARVLMLWIGEGDPGDGVNRTITALAWVTDGYRLFGADTWPELNYLLPAAAIRATGELYWGPRILYALVSLALVPLAFALAAPLADRRGARAVAWLAALLPYALVLGTDGARGELSFVVGVLFAALFAQRWIARGFRLSDAVLAACGVIWAEGFRFDGVVAGAAVGAAMTLAVIVRHMRDGIRAATGRAIVGLAVFAALSLAYPVALGVEWQHRYGDALYFMHTAATNASQFLVGGEHARWPTWFYRMYGALFPILGAAYLLTPVFALLALLGIVKSWRQPLAWPLLAALACYTIFFVRGMATMLVQPQLRYAAIHGMLALPFVAVGLSSLRAETSAWMKAGLTPRRVGIAGMVIAALVQVMVGIVTLRPFGILTRQLSGTGIVPVSRFESRQLLRAIEAQPTATRLIISSFVPGSYAYLSDAFRRMRVPVEFASIYRTSTLVMTREEFERATAERLTPGTLLMVETSGRQQGFTDGLSVDPIGLAVGIVGDAVVWRGVPLRVLARSDHLALVTVGDGAAR